MYSVMNCIYNCSNPEVSVPSESFKSHKKEAIDEHLCTFVSVVQKHFDQQRELVELQ